MLGLYGTARKILRDMGVCPEKFIPESERVPVQNDITANERIITIKAGTKYAYNQYFAEDIVIDLDNPGIHYIYNVGEYDSCWKEPDYEQEEWQEQELPVWGSSEVYVTANYSPSQGNFSINSQALSQAPDPNNMSFPSYYSQQDLITLFFFQLDSSGNIINLQQSTKMTKSTDIYWVQNYKSPTSGSGVPQLFTPENLYASGLDTAKTYVTTIDTWHATNYSDHRTWDTHLPTSVVDQFNNVYIDQPDVISGSEYSLIKTFTFTPLQSSMHFTVTYGTRNGSRNASYAAKDLGDEYRSLVYLTADYDALNEPVPNITLSLNG